ncbi:Fic family protein [Microvirga brassicacearum]|uniref:Fic family protein n=1 Tax=Microvirga brassicacearum TaxID=2580413 RepID=A0A5N3PAI9_9HYPH|nr:Fic family protein [Microvirga brassicacearum]KAB0266724.1 Fic family protein [Microvirga brassicacearum]
MSDGNNRRDSHALEPEIVNDPIAKAERETLNGFRQYDYGIQVTLTALERGAFKLRMSLILALQREALNGLSLYAGNFRPGGVEIKQSSHTPPDAHLVPPLVEEMCDYVNENWDTATSIHLAAYVMWRLNWIHPFADGNGRTSRILSYILLSIHSKGIPPGTPTISDLIVDNRMPYFEALDAADDAWKEGRVDLSKMEDLLENLLAKQLMGYFQQAGGKIEDQNHGSGF